MVRFWGTGLAQTPFFRPIIKAIKIGVMKKVAWSRKKSFRRLPGRYKSKVVRQRRNHRRLESNDNLGGRPVTTRKSKCSQRPWAVMSGSEQSTSSKGQEAPIVIYSTASFLRPRRSLAAWNSFTTRTDSKVATSRSMWPERSWSRPPPNSFERRPADHPAK